jgi:endonuclease YncB( thermonuclease family)
LFIHCGALITFAIMSELRRSDRSGAAIDGDKAVTGCSRTSTARRKDYGERMVRAGWASVYVYEDRFQSVSLDAA